MMFYYLTKGLHKGTSAAPVLPSSKFKTQLEEYLFGAEVSVSGSRCNILRDNYKCFAKIRAIMETVGVLVI